MKFTYYAKKAILKLYGSYIRDSIIHGKARVEPLSQVVNSTLGKYSYCGYNCKLLNVNIGNYCSIADNVVIGGASHPMEWVSTSPAFYYGRDSISKELAKKEYQGDNQITTVENDVWIGNNVIIKSGITINTGAVIGMGSVLTKDVGPYEIWGGNPAKMIKKRFDDSIIDKLLVSKWWEWDNSKLSEISHTIDNIDEFLKNSMD